MADNVEANAGSGGATFATDDIAGVHYPRTKIALGADGAATDALGGAGAVAAGVIRATLASDDPAVTSLAILDDWDETDRAKVNLIVGQAGIAAGAGAVGATVPRVTLASDDPAVTALQTLDNAISGNEMQVDIVTMPTVTVNAHAVTNAGTFAVQVDGNALTALQLLDNVVLVDDAAFTPGTSSVSMAGFQADEASTDSVDEGDAGAARMTLDRKVIVNPQPHTTGGLTTARSLDLDETEEEIKASAGQVYGWNITNFRTSTVYVKFYNATAANVTVGTTTPLFTLAIPGNATDDTMLSMMGTHGIVFDTAITWAATTGLADNDTGAPAANDVAGTVWYK